MSLFAVLTTLLSFILIIAGGLVTSTGSGLAVPDWPLSYGTLFPPMVGGIRFEHSHRMIAAAVGMLTLILTLWVLAVEKRQWVRRLALGCFGLIVLQGILGGLTVLWQLPPSVSVLHACLGQTFFAAICILARVLSPEWENRTVAQSDQPSSGLYRLSLSTACVVYGQLILGAAMRHAGWLPHLLMAHLAGAAASFFLVAMTAHTVSRRYREDPFFSRPARRLALLLLLQVGLGIATFFSGHSVFFATAHVAVGALLLAHCALLTISLSYFSAHPVHRTSRPLQTYLELTKPQLTLMAVVTALIGFMLAAPHPVDARTLAAVVLGTVLVGAGASALNQYLERDADARMERTRNRPLPSGRLNPESALLFGVAASVGGLLTLSFGANFLAGTLAAATLATYLFLYTPLKSRTALCTLVGAIPGAIPPLIGWAAARGHLSIEAWILFSILFLWQLPHFLAIAWTWREDYARAGFRMLPVLDPEGSSTGRQIVLYCLALLPVSLMPAALGSFGWIYFSVALISSLAFLACGFVTARVRSGASARRLFLASILYLPVILTTMTLDRVILS